MPRNKFRLRGAGDGRDPLSTKGHGNQRHSEKTDPPCRYHWVFAKRSDISVEIHWHIKRPEGPFIIDIDGFWERAQWSKIAGIEALVLSPEDLVLYLCQHFWKHKLLGGIRPLCDIAESTKYYSGELDWAKLNNISSEWDMNPCSYLGLSLAKDLLNAPEPADVLRAIRPVNFDIEVTIGRGKHSPRVWGMSVGFSRSCEAFLERPLG